MRLYLDREVGVLSGGLGFGVGREWLEWMEQPGKEAVVQETVERGRGTVEVWNPVSCEVYGLAGSRTVTAVPRLLCSS